MMTVLLVLVFALAVVALLVATPVLERWATTAPSPVDAAPAEAMDVARQV